MAGLTLVAISWQEARLNMPIIYYIYTKLSDFHAQFRMVGNNYNQTLKELKSHFSERRTMALVCKLEKYMMQLVLIMHKVTELTDEYRQKNLEK